MFCTAKLQKYLIFKDIFRKNIGNDEKMLYLCSVNKKQSETIKRTSEQNGLKEVMEEYVLLRESDSQIADDFRAASNWQRSGAGLPL